MPSFFFLFPSPFLIIHLHASEIETFALPTKVVPFRAEWGFEHILWLFSCARLVLRAWELGFFQRKLNWKLCWQCNSQCGYWFPKRSIGHTTTKSSGAHLILTSANGESREYLSLVKWSNSDSSENRWRRQEDFKQCQNRLWVSYSSVTPTSPSAAESPSIFSRVFSGTLTFPLQVKFQLGHWLLIHRSKLG